jgi:hypothetical protein
MKTGRYQQQITPVQPAKKTKERKVPLSQPGSKGFNQKVMENSKAFYSGTGGKL